jgi:hypothetical protein
MFYTNTTTLLLLHEDRVKDLQKMHEPLPFFRLWSFRRKSKAPQDSKHLESRASTSSTFTDKERNLT